MNATSIPIESARIEPVGAFFAAVKRPRIDSVDLLRGIIMILMALDYTRRFLTNVDFSPTELSATTPASPPLATPSAKFSPGLPNAVKPFSFVSGSFSPRPSSF
jgi:uncharacterized membrane protein